MLNAINFYSFNFSILLFPIILVFFVFMKDIDVKMTH